MPPIVRRHLHQTAVLWPRTGYKPETGEATVGEPEEISCRWVWGRTETTDAQGNTVSLDGSSLIELATDRQSP